MKNVFKLVLIYILMFISTIILDKAFTQSYKICDESAFLIMFFNTILFLYLIKFLKVNKNSVSVFLIILILLFIVPIIDKDYFFSNFEQCTQDILMFPQITYILTLILWPFIGLFYISYILPFWKFCFVYIITYFIFLIYISRAVLSFDGSLYEFFIRYKNQ